MVKYYNGNVNFIINNVKRITENQKKVLLSNGSIRRFWHLSKIEGIGGTTYEKIYKLCKENVDGHQENQLSLFDFFD